MLQIAEVQVQEEGGNIGRKENQKWGIRERYKQQNDRAQLPRDVLKSSAVSYHIYIP